MHIGTVPHWRHIPAALFAAGKASDHGPIQKTLRLHRVDVPGTAQHAVEPVIWFWDGLWLDSGCRFDRELRPNFTGFGSIKVWADRRLVR